MRRLLLWAVALALALPLVLLVALALAPPRLLGDLAERVAALFTDADLSVEALDLRLFDATPSAVFEGVSLGAADGAGGAAAQAPLLAGADGRVALDLGALFGGDLVLERVALDGAELSLRRDADGRGNWEALLPQGAGVEERSGGEGKGGGGLGLPAIREIAIEDVRLDYRDAALERRAELSLAASGSTTDPERPTRVDAEGALDGLPFALDAELSPLGALSESLESLGVDVETRLGNASATLEGRIGDPLSLAELDVTFGAEAEDTEDLERLARVPLPTLPPFSLEGALLREGEDIVLRRFSGQLGDSDVEGDARVNASTSPPSVYANVISRTLDLDDLAGVLGGVPDPDERASAAQREEAEARAEDDRLLPDDPLGLAELTRAFQGAIRYRAEEVRSPVWPIEAIDARVEVEGGQLEVSALELDAGGGRVHGSAAIDARPRPADGSAELRLSGVDLGAVMESVGIDDDSFGQIGGEAKLWFAGDSVAEFAASADGGLFLLMTEGQLDALLAELAGLDLVESLALALDPDKTRTPIDCAYLDLQLREGIAEIARFVIDTADTVFIADGRVDLGEESFDVAIEPHPKDATLVGAQSSVRVSGRIGDLRVLPGPELPTRAAAAAALATLAAPVAALLPFVQTGSTEDSPYCDGLVTALDAAR